MDMDRAHDESTVTLAQEPGAELKILVSVDETLVDHALPAIGEITIGRAPGNAICIDHPSVSRLHARLHLTPALAIEDLGSANGVRILDQLIATGRRVPFRVGDLVELGAAILQVRQVRQVPPVRPGRGGGGARGKAGDASPMRALRGLAEQVAASNISVLILGETGAGKEVLARSLHARSPRAGGTFLALNCAALPESLLESELFGHEKGAFTGAAALKVGLLESAHGGTVFLDEIGELPATIQVKLLRVLAEHAILRIGAVRPRAIDVRFLAATNRDLDEDVRAGRFREDLYFRLNGVTLAVPPLRERTDEIEALARRFVEEACARDGRCPVPTFAPEAIERLRTYRWPGNVRELRNVVDRAVLVCRGSVIGIADLPVERGGAAPERRMATPPPSTTGGELHIDIQALERQRILEALERCAGNQKLAAKQLGISRNTLGTRMDAFGFRRPRKPRSA
jgi:two-component system, NtrC family, response regulator AtoC